MPPHCQVLLPLKAEGWNELGVIKNEGALYRLLECSETDTMVAFAVIGNRG